MRERRDAGPNGHGAEHAPTDEASSSGRPPRGPRGEGRRGRGDELREREDATLEGAEAAADTRPANADAAATNEPRERRPRERRERRERPSEHADAAVTDERAAAPAEARPAPSDAPRSYFARAAQARPKPRLRRPRACRAPSAGPCALAGGHGPSGRTRRGGAAAAPAPMAPPAPAPAGLPKVTGFALPVDTLANPAGAAGLQWINSDADKVAAVQAAIAAEPAPIRVPRERPPAVELDDGPLILVETRKDWARSACLSSSRHWTLAPRNRMLCHPVLWAQPAIGVG
jgi:ribonuclease E